MLRQAYDKKNEYMTNDFISMTSRGNCKTKPTKSKTEKPKYKSNRKKVRTENRELETKKKYPQELRIPLVVLFRPNYNTIIFNKDMKKTTFKKLR